ncbi:dicarboxylate/amino acid:cation symporter [Oleiharenicola lentus]|uniref:dicarboxylate/amino acid:cation symporter n=1 Tax=Oleiharenicola lentus TaxID=2508720 RepID=UPI003F67375D
MKIFRSLYVQVLVAIVAGVLLGYFEPDFGASLKPLGDGFIKLIKMLIGPIIFCTVVSGIGGMGDLKSVGRVGAKALLYFEIVTTLALVIGLIVANLIRPGDGLHIVTTAKDAADVALYTKAAAHLSTVDWLLHLIPNTFVSAFVEGDVLQVLVVALLFGCALAHLGTRGEAVVSLLHDVSKVFFTMVSYVSKLAPIAAFGAMAFTIGKYGLGSLASLAQVLACVYLTCFLFIVIVLGSIARFSGFSLWKIIKFIREELLIVLGTSSSEAGLPGLMTKMERAGCKKSVVGVVVPSGYSFNLDGTCIYLTMAALFIAQATDTQLSLYQQIGLLAVLLVTSKGAAGVTGSGFIVLAATLAATKTIPVEGMALILGIDRFMSEARAITNFIGNSVATLVVSKWDKSFDASVPEAQLVLK